MQSQPTSSPDIGPATRAPLARRLVPALYGLADALVPPRPGARGGGDVDVAPALARRLRQEGPGAARRVHATLLLLEWAPVVLPGGGRPFSRLPRARRVRLLAAARRGPLAGALRRLEARVEAALCEVGLGRGEPAGPRPAGDEGAAHSSDGA